MSREPVESASELRFEGVSVQLGEQLVLDDVSFALVRDTDLPDPPELDVSLVAPAAPLVARTFSCVV